jgi:hypothetical protein
MNFEDAKETILLMSEEIKKGTFTEETLTRFVLSFRHELFNKPKFEMSIPQAWQPGMGVVSCSCGPEEASCNECGDGKYTKFIFDANNMFVSFEKCDKEDK